MLTRRWTKRFALVIFGVRHRYMRRESSPLIYGSTLCILRLALVIFLPLGPTAIRATVWTVDQADSVMDLVSVAFGPAFFTEECRTSRWSQQR